MPESEVQRLRGLTHFYLGTHCPNWLASSPVPLFVSHRRLKDRKTFSQATRPWALDSGGFTEMHMFGGWVTTPREYVTAVRRYCDEIGVLEWASPQDWMCEPTARERSGKTVADHQRLTIENFLALRCLAPDLPFIPALQGWEPDDYERCVELYDRAGVNLYREPLVGLGTVCRRQNTAIFRQIVDRLQGIRLHAFGVKATGLALCPELASADSMAWSYDARRSAPLPGHSHKNCANCIDYALAWRRRLLARPIQQRLVA